jgi:hypothetical protein
LAISQGDFGAKPAESPDSVWTIGLDPQIETDLRRVFLTIASITVFSIGKRSLLMTDNTQRGSANNADVELHECWCFSLRPAEAVNA